MTLDVPTLTIAGSFVALLSGIMLIFTWQQYREMSAFIWWAASDFVLAAGIALLAYGEVSGNQPVLSAAFGCLTLATALVWTSARRLNGHRVRYATVAAGTMIVLAINLLPSSLPVADIRGGLSTFVSAAYLFAAAWTLVLHSKEKLASRWPLAGFVLLHAGMLLTGAITAAVLGGVPPLPELTSVFGMIHFEALIFVVGTTIFVIAAMRESREARYLLDAQTDALTGLTNRRAFLQFAERTAARCARGGEPIAVAVFDLDHFKRVNDTFGHAFGDEVLRLFARTARDALRPGDIISRVGGEEFFAVLPGATLSEALKVANRVRETFASAALSVDGTGVKATVSAGVMADSDSDTPLATMLENADAALYKAKLNGRNRVEAGGNGITGRTYPRLVKVA